MICRAIFTLIIFNFLRLAVTLEHCPCGWRVAETNELYTHSMFYDFTQSPDQNSDNHDIRLNAKYDYRNVEIKNGNLVMRQQAYSEEDRKAFKPVSIAGIQTRSTDILHGTFRSELKLVGYDGGSCASFFWYHDDRSEIDIEVVTPGNSFVNNTINYTTHPAINAMGEPIPNATFSLPLSNTLKEFKTHRFDCDPARGVKYYLNNDLMHTDTHNIPAAGGSLQLKLWADGNKWWSGIPSRSNVELHIRSLVTYFNTSTSSTDQRWADTCAKSKRKPCAAQLQRLIPSSTSTALPKGYLPTNSATRLAMGVLLTVVLFLATVAVHG